MTIDCSVIVPVYEHWDRATALIDALQRQSLPPDRFEVLLVDNGSRNFSPPAQLPANVHVYRCHTPGSYAARNFGIKHAKGRWIVFTDADCLPDCRWLENLLNEAAQAGSRPTLVAGRVDVIALSDRPGAYEIYDVVKGIPQAWYVSRGYAASANLAAPATTVRNLNGFDESRYSGGDFDFCRRAAQAGVALRYAPDAVVKHPARDTWAALETKARRVKGAHLVSGSAGRRVYWLVRTFSPPVIAIYRFLTSSGMPFRCRLVAVLVQFRIWWVEIREVFRLIGSSTPERR